MHCRPNCAEKARLHVTRNVASVLLLLPSQHGKVRQTLPPWTARRRYRRGRPRMENLRQLLSLRLPADVIERWRASGPGWQTRMAKVLENSAP